MKRVFLFMLLVMAYMNSSMARVSTKDCSGRTGEQDTVIVVHVRDNEPRIIVKKELSRDYGLLKGRRYRGYFDIAVNAGNDGIYYGWNKMGYGFYTTHGYQCNPYIFVGGGFGLHYNTYHNLSPDSNISIPVYHNVRFNLTKKRVSPYADVKAGYTFVSTKGVFFSPSFGLRCGLEGRGGVNIQVGYILQNYRYISLDRVRSAFMHCLNASVGIDW